MVYLAGGQLREELHVEGFKWICVHVAAVPNPISEINGCSGLGIIRIPNHNFDVLSVLFHNEDVKLGFLKSDREGESKNNVFHGDKSEVWGSISTTKSMFCLDLSNAN